MTACRVPLRERAAFALGDTGYNFVWHTLELYLLYYYVSVLGLAPGEAALIYLAGACADLAGDPLIGVAIDRLRLRISMRGWVVLAGPPLGLALALVFVPPPVAGAGGIAFLAATHALMRFAYALGNIPYAALTARMTGDAEEQVRLTGARLQGAALGGIVAALVYLALPLGRAGPGGVPLGAIALGLAAQPLFVLCWAGVRERIEPPLAPSRSPSRQAAEIALLFRRSPDLRRLLAQVFVSGMACTILYKGLMFVFERPGLPRMGYAAALLPPVILLLGAPVWSRLARRIGPVATLRTGCALNLVAVLAAIAFFDSAAATLALMAGASFATVGISLMFFAMIPMVVRECESRLVAGGCAARIFGFASLARKIAAAIAPQAVLLALALPGGAVLPASAIAGAIALLVALFFAPDIGKQAND